MITLKKMMLAAVAAVTLSACSGDREYLDYRGVSMATPCKAFVDSMTRQGLVVDTSNHEKGTVVFLKPGSVMQVIVKAQNDTIVSIQESYEATYNDSTRQLFQTMREQLIKELDMNPYMPVNTEDHREARFKTKKGIVTLVLENTYTPRLDLLYESRNDDSK
ncbi:MAG: hypothetical protein SPF39_03040 [Prevotella sp.]|nr:hypothetical protein [Prevotella sp.]